MSETKVITGKVRLSYVHLFDPQEDDKGNAKYSVSIIIPKSDKSTIKKIEAAIEAAKKIGKSSKFGGKIPANVKIPLRDGDTDREEDESYSNSFFVNATSFRKPGLVDADVNPILDRAELYSGCYGRVSLNFYPYNYEGNKGIAAGLNNVQKLEDGEPLGAGVTSAEDDFGGDDDLM